MRQRSGCESLNARVAAWHLVEDVLGWLAVLVVTVVLLFVDLPVLDPALSTVISIYILYNVLRNLRQTLMLFLQVVPEEIDLRELERQLDALSHVHSTHHIHVWSIDGAHHVLTAHIVVDSQTSKAEVSQLQADIARISDQYHFAHTTIEIEWEDEECRMGQRLTGT